MLSNFTPCSSGTPATGLNSTPHHPRCHATWPTPQRRTAHRLKAGSFQQPPSDDEDGNPQVQDALVSMIKLEIGKKQVEEYVEDSGEKLKQIAEEAKEEMERLANLSKMRGDLAFDSALADINKEADEFEEQLKKSREEQAALDEEFSMWETDMAASRSEGQFFKNLYQTDKKKPVGESSEMLKERARRVLDPARQEIGSPVRFYLFLSLAFLLAADVGADIASDDPSMGPDILYTALAAMAVWLSFNERKAL